MTIPQAAIDAVAETYEQIAAEDHEYRDLIGIDWTIIRDALEAAMPHLRKQIAAEIRAERGRHEQHERGIHNFSIGMEHAARIAEGDPK